MDAELHFLDRATMVFSTDKPMYQPGQTLHMRCLLIDEKQMAWAKQTIRFKVTDPEDETVFDLSGETSQFGIASAEFAIPDSMKFGTYTVEAILNSGEAERTVEAGKRVRIPDMNCPHFQ